MSQVSAALVLGKSLKAVGVDTIFYLRGFGHRIYEICDDLGIKLIDVRHEQAAALAAHAYARVTGRPGVFMTGPGPDTLNTATGMATALADCAPVVGICSSETFKTHAMDAFQDLNQLDVMKPIVKTAWRVPIPERIPAFVGMAFRAAISNKPGPVYLEFPRNVLALKVEESEMETPDPPVRQRPEGNREAVAQAIEVLLRAERPVIISGYGVVWSGASAELQEFVETTNIPFYTTPLARGVVPDDHPLSFPGARATACREADAVMVVGSRPSFILFFLKSPQFSAQARIIMVNIDAEAIGHNRRVDVGIQGDARVVLKQLTEEARRRSLDKRTLPWIERLRKVSNDREAAMQPVLSSDEKPINPLRLCKEIRDFMPRDTILVVDGNETLHFARQTLPGYYPGHVLNPGLAATMGVGVPYGLGAKVARPDKPVLVFTGDGSFGFNAMEIDTAVRHGVPIVVVINNNGGHSSIEPNARKMVGRDLGFTRYDKLAESLGGYGEFVENPGDIRPALERAFASGKPAVVNVITDPYGKASRQVYQLDGGRTAWDF
ncbi:MAG: thiamine pyrophosphate-binding protein [Chloroflexi bacterium]|nr:thiamine pyrophosphate-binding protein [Chloroflexota bacterium]